MSKRLVQPTTPSGSIFSYLWLARDVASLGDWVLLVAAFVYISRFSESPSILGQLMVVVFAPRFLLRPILNRFVTWRNAVAFGVTAQLMQATILLPILLLEMGDGAQPILILAFSYSVARLFVGAAHEALFRAVVSRELRELARGVLTNTWLLTLVVGPAFGHVIFGTGGMQGAAIATLAACLASAGALLLAHLQGRIAEPLAQEDASLLASISPLPAGIVVAFRDPRLQSFAVFQILTALLAGGLLVAEAAYTINGLFISIESFGLLLAAQGLGIAVAGFCYQRFARQRFAPSTLVATGLFLLSAGVLGLSIASGLPAGLGLFTAIGFGVGLFIFSISRSGEEVAARARIGSRATLGVGIAVDVALVISAAAAGPLCASISPRFSLDIIGILICVLALFAFVNVPDQSPDEGTLPKSNA